MVRKLSNEQAMALFGLMAALVVAVLVLPPYDWREDAASFLLLPVILLLFWIARYYSRAAEAKELKEMRRRRGRRAGPRGGRWRALRP